MTYYTGEDTQKNATQQLPFYQYLKIANRFGILFCAGLFLTVAARLNPEFRIGILILMVLFGCVSGCVALFGGHENRLPAALVNIFFILSILAGMHDFLGVLFTHPDYRVFQIGLPIGIVVLGAVLLFGVRFVFQRRFSKF